MFAPCPLYHNISFVCYIVKNILELLSLIFESGKKYQYFPEDTPSLFGKIPNINSAWFNSSDFTHFIS